jgi:hypothetical protein
VRYADFNAARLEQHVALARPPLSMSSASEELRESQNIRESLHPYYKDVHNNLCPGHRR